jgi:formamidopyrimidine-DNA glycosylase
MPELPEVETVRRGLAPALEGATIVAAEVRRPDLRFPFPDGLQAMLEGARITALTRRAKYLLIELDKGTTLIAHLGMSGSYRVHSLLDQPLRSRSDRPLADPTSSIPDVFHHARSTLGAHDHLVLQVDGGAAGPSQIVYNDPRRFGFVLSASTAKLHDHPFLADLGPEPLGNALTPHHLAARFASRRSPLKSALLDQKNIAGLGNIYVCEALSRARLSPKRLAQSLVKKTGAPTARLIALERIIRQVIGEAIAAGGSSLRDHKQTDGTMGYFQHNFGVYDREHDGCPNEGCRGTVKRIVQSGRSTFYCPTCQR